MEVKTKKRWRTALIVLLALFAVFSAASFVFIKVSFDDTFARTSLRELTVYLRYDDAADRYPRELLDFPSGDNRLQGYLYGAENGRGLVVLSHGLGGGAEGSAALEGVRCIENGTPLPVEDGYIILNRALAAGDRVLLLRVQSGQKFIVLSRIFEGG